MLESNVDFCEISFAAELQGNREIAGKQGDCRETVNCYYSYVEIAGKQGNCRETGELQGNSGITGF